MSSEEIKTEIKKVIENIPDNVLEDILALLKEFEAESKDRIAFTHNLRKIITEDRDLLKKLAL